MMLVTTMLLLCNNDFIGPYQIAGRGRWAIGDPASFSGDFSAAPAGDLWPHQVMSWEYRDRFNEFQSDPLVTVTGNINILCIDIDISL